MNVVIDIDEFEIENVFFQDSVKNTVMDDSNFIRTIYSTNLFTLNGIFLKIAINTLSVEKYFNKYKCSFDKVLNAAEVSKIVSIEECILNRINIKNKRATYKIYDQLECGNIKLFTDSTDRRINNQYILKISGIWETEREYGVTYKFAHI
jgi:hypothetical protein